MRILFLGPPQSNVRAYLEAVEDHVVATSDPVTRERTVEESPDFIVSHGYRHIIGRDVLDLFPDRAINLHISLLPWNRGADPNFWSFVDDTPKGVTIHFLDEGIDTGDIIAQRMVQFGDEETLRTSYQRLQREIAQLFRGQWPGIRSGRCGRTPQRGRGSFHRSRDKEALASLLEQGWDTPVRALRKDRRFV
jgi:methionyl-tRNA formyltransferase